jgi:FKBP-type peptidyl-prolyl cis-trans isomerase
MTLAGNARAQQTPAAKTEQAPAAKSQNDVALKTQKEKASYAIGLNIGRSLQSDSVDVDPDILLQGLRDALAGSEPLLTDDEAKEALAAGKNASRRRDEPEARRSISGC